MISPIQRDPIQCNRLIDAIERTLPFPASVVGLVEIGSYAKDEAVPTSDTDTRAYVKAVDDTALLLMSERLEPAGFTHTREQNRSRDPHCMGYVEFNEKLRSTIATDVDNDVSVGFIDVLHAETVFTNLDRFPSQDHAMLFQSTIIFDPDNWIAQWRSQLTGIVTDALISMYHAQVTTRTFTQLPKYATTGDTQHAPHQWLLQAVRCIREAAALKSLAESGTFIFTRHDVLTAINQRYPQSLGLVTQLYNWKCDANVRQKIVSSALNGDDGWSQRYITLTPAVQNVVNQLLSGLKKAQYTGKNSLGQKRVSR